MKWLKAFGWIPVPVFYTENMDEKFGGMMRIIVIPMIFIRPKYRDTDLGIHMHELEHAEQAWRHLLLFHALLYWLSDRYRLWAEVVAYRRQIACYPEGTSIDFAVNALTSKYDLDVTVERARNLLLGEPI